jgi:Concanavalin A-like lectin/glucanases superfamily
VWDGKWHHAAGTYDGSTVRLFIDGVEVGRGTPANTPIASNPPAGAGLIGDVAGAPGRRHLAVPEGAVLDQPLSSALLAGVIEGRVGHRLLDALEDAQQLGHAADEQALLVDLDPRPG